MAVTPLRQSLDARWADWRATSESRLTYHLRWPSTNANEPGKADEVTQALREAAEAADLADGAAGANAGAGKRRDDLHYAIALRAPSIRAFDRYLELFPSGRHARSAEAQRQQRLNDDSVFDDAVRRADAEMLRVFIEESPGHPRLENARTALLDLRGLQIEQALAQDRIEGAVTMDDGLVTVSMRSRLPHAVRIRVDRGTIFRVQDGKGARAVALEGAADVVVRPAASGGGTDGWTRLELLAVRIDGNPSAPANSLLRVVPAAAPEAQAVPGRYGSLIARWPAGPVAVSDGRAALALFAFNRSWSQLPPQPGDPLERARQVVRALMILNEAGFPPPQFRVWRDRKTLLQASAGEPALRRWVESQP